HASDGCIPSDMTTATAEQIEEERRLLYVAMTRARDSLHVIHPVRYFVHHQHRHGDRHVHAPRTRFITDDMLDPFEQVSHCTTVPGDAVSSVPSPAVDAGSGLKAMWT